MYLLVRKRHDQTVVKHNKIISGENVGGIKIVYNIVKPGVSFLGRTWGDKILGEIVFFKPLSRHLNPDLESKITGSKVSEAKKARNNNTLANTWLIVNSDFDDIHTALYKLRIKHVIKESADLDRLTYQTVVNSLKNNVQKFYLPNILYHD